MATMGEFGSLLQLGFGIGAGLSAFRAPILRRSSRLSQQIDQDLSAISGVPTEEAHKKIEKLSSLALDLSFEMSKLNRLEKPFLILAVLGAAVNIILLIYGSMYAQEIIGKSMQYVIIFFSTFYYLIIAGMLELLTWATLDNIKTRYMDIDQI